ncbi:hypothetical protein K466DRAFT_611406 [Polyporus arcularius HHB13444]|uniref:Uncharacterized protein n=1 Tax=Polyporus arcularius HHB13444 TaxID=1314778 RepID=A0A5C3NMW7_9APHY|nr:hypothetical protein K466DRAFT_611406 [Polyporus arcularius HHB13444]
MHALFKLRSPASEDIDCSGPLVQCPSGEELLKISTSRVPAEQVMTTPCNHSGKFFPSTSALPAAQVVQHVARLLCITITWGELRSHGDVGFSGVIGLRELVCDWMYNLGSELSAATQPVRSGSDSHGAPRASCDVSSRTAHGTQSMMAQALSMESHKDVSMKSGCASSTWQFSLDQQVTRTEAVPDANRENHDRMHDLALCAAMGPIRRVVCIMTTAGTLPRLS